MRGQQKETSGPADHVVIPCGPNEGWLSGDMRGPEAGSMVNAPAPACTPPCMRYGGQWTPDLVPGRAD